MKLHARNIFLLDGLGALASGGLMALIIAQNVPFFGMPANAAYFLAIFPAVFLIYSFYYHYNPPKVIKPYLKLITIANLCYCFISIGVVFWFFQQLSSYGLIYFMLEIIVIILVVLLELRVLRESPA